MPTFMIETKGEARETYIFEAEDEDEARFLFEQGEIVIGVPTVEVEGAEIVKVTKVQN